MRIDEFAQKEEFKPQFDLADDTLVFMRNDPMFYRKHYLPAMIKFAKFVNDGNKEKARNSVLPVVDRGIVDYCKKFNIAKTPQDVFKDTDRKAIVELLMSEEMPNIKKGEYK
jgi:hypothetical protein